MNVPIAEMIPYQEGLWTLLAPIWGALTGQLPATSAFLSPEWTGTWLEVFGPRLRPTTMVWRDGDGAPVGCVLWCTQPARVGPFKLRRLHLNASGDYVAGCEFNDVLALPEHRGAILAQLVRRVLDVRPDELALVGFRPTAADELRALWPTSKSEGYASEGPYVSLGELRQRGTPYLSAISSNTRAKIRRSDRAYAEALGAPTLEIAVGATQALEWLEEMVVLHQARWRDRGLPGAFASVEAQRFHKALVGRFAQPQLSHGLAVDLVRIRCGPESIAFLYNLRYRGSVSFYQSGVQYSSDKRLSPGLMANAMAVDHYLRAGEQEYDFLAGEADPVQYKRSLSTHMRSLVWIQLPAPTARMAAIGALRRARRKLRSVFLRNRSSQGAGSSDATAEATASAATR